MDLSNTAEIVKWPIENWKNITITLSTIVVTSPVWLSAYAELQIQQHRSGYNADSENDIYWRGEFDTILKKIFGNDYEERLGISLNDYRFGKDSSNKEVIATLKDAIYISKTYRKLVTGLWYDYEKCKEQGDSCDKLLHALESKLSVLIHEKTHLDEQRGLGLRANLMFFARYVYDVEFQKAAELRAIQAQLDGMKSISHELSDIHYEEVMKLVVYSIFPQRLIKKGKPASGYEAFKDDFVMKDKLSAGVAYILLEIYQQQDSSIKREDFAALADAMDTLEVSEEYRPWLQEQGLLDFVNRLMEEEHPTWNDRLDLEMQGNDTAPEIPDRE
jgi:hypothetical protein